MFQPPINNLVVTVATKYIGNYSNIMKAANLNPSNQLNPADLVQIVGTVVALPKAIDTKRRGYEGFSLKDIEVGDTVLMRFDVICEMTEQEFSDVPLYKNMVYYKQREYFLCDIMKAYAVIKPDDKRIIMLNSYCMITDLEPEPLIFIPQYQKRVTRAKEGTLEQIGNTIETEKRIDAYPGQRVMIHPHKAVEYQISGKKFWITSQKHILGVVEQS